MQNESIFEQIPALKEKFREFFQHRKQVAALDNFSFIKTFSKEETKIIGVVKFCLKGAFLEPEDAEWIGSKLKKLEINYLDWAHRTTWLKAQLAGTPVKKLKPAPVQTFFNFDRKDIPINVPLEILNGNIPSLAKRAG